MLAIDVRTNVDAFLRTVNDFRIDQLPYAMSLAMNASVDKAKDGMRAEMTRVFDRPTPYTLGGVYGVYSTKRRLVAQLKLKDNREDVSLLTPGASNKGSPAALYLGPQIEGGARQHKRLEAALTANGLLPPGMFAVPAKNAPLDAYGNVPTSFVIRMLSDLRSFREAGSPANRPAGRRRGWRATNYFFSVPDPRSRRKNAHLRPGIYWHMPGGLLNMVYVYVKSVAYPKRFDFYGVGEKLLRAEFPKQFPAAWRRAMATARPQ